MNAKLIKQQMEEQSWQFRGFYDEKQKHRFIGKYGDYGCLIDLKTDKVEYWHYNHDWFVNYKPDDFFQQDLEVESCTCDCCGGIEINMSDLIHVNICDKYCKTCCKNNSESC